MVLLFVHYLFCVSLSRERKHFQGYNDDVASCLSRDSIIVHNLDPVPETILLRWYLHLNAH